MKKTQYKYSIICPKCQTIPFLTINPDIPLKVAHLCKCSSQSYILKDYLKYLYLMNKSNHSINCQALLSHCDIKSSGYCKKCNEYLCKKCIKIHKVYKRKNHPILKYKYYYQKCRIVKNKHYEYLYCTQCRLLYCPECDFSHKSHLFLMQEDIKAINPELIKQNLNKEVKKNFLFLLNNIFYQAKSNNKELIHSYKECIKRNKQIITLLKIILYNYNSSDDNQYSFVIKISLYRNSHFNFTPSTLILFQI